MRCRLIFAHGAGRAGVHAWPQQAELANEAVFVTFPGYGEEPPTPTNIDAWVERLLAASTDPVHLIGHSFGAIPAVMAADRRPGWCRSLLLFEPALYSLARGSTSVERHIDRLTPVMAEAGSLDAAVFWQRWMTALTGTSPDPAETPAQLAAAERFRLLTPPWTFQVSTAVFVQVATLVVTAGWNQEYEEIAHALTRLGAQHRLLPGNGHRLVDDSAATNLIYDWATTHDSEG